MPISNLEDRTFEFAKRVRAFCRKLKWDSINIEDIKQVVRASGSVAANYIEANENLGEKDFKMKIKICRREAKEAGMFLRLVDTGNGEEMETERTFLVQETVEFRKIFTTIINRSGN